LPTKADNYQNWTSWDEPTRLLEPEQKTTALGTGLLIGGLVLGAAFTALGKTTEARVAEPQDEPIEDQEVILAEEISK
jgi:hypothetical protein